MNCCLDGGFDIRQMAPGKLADFNMWQHEMTEDELNSDSCGARGDVASWETLKEKGTSLRTKHVLPSCIGK